MNTCAIIQARMSSSRLPGKVLLDISGKPMLLHVVERAGRAATVDQVAVATTTEASDDPIETLCKENGIPCCRGSLHDVLDRYYQAALTLEAQVVVRLTADCPLIDPQVIDRTVRAFWGESQPQDQILSGASSQSDNLKPFVWDFTANRLPPPWGRTYPIGLDTEVCSFPALQRAWSEATLPYQREHVMPYLYDQKERFRVLLIHHSQDFGSLRWTVDEANDLELVRQIFAAFSGGMHPGRNDFSWLEVLESFLAHPEWAQINAGVQHKSYTDIDARRS
jgi:spore coat polysaccharide biosynthesis protein SpsF